jgi:hypothetical protein
MMEILSENSKIEYPVSAFKARGKKICAWRLLLHKKIPKFI